MMLSIAVLAGIGYVLSFISHLTNGKIDVNLTNGKIDVNLILAAILVISTWSILPLAIIVMCITALIGII